MNVGLYVHHVHTPWKYRWRTSENTTWCSQAQSVDKRSFLARNDQRACHRSLGWHSLQIMSLHEYGDCCTIEWQNFFDKTTGPPGTISHQRKRTLTSQTRVIFWSKIIAASCTRALDGWWRRRNSKKCWKWSTIWTWHPLTRTKYRQFWRKGHRVKWSRICHWHSWKWTHLNRQKWHSTPTRLDFC